MTKSTAPNMTGANVTGKNIYALLVGINQYSPQGLVPALRGCVADVQAMQRFLLQRVGVPMANLLVLTDAQATRAAILAGWRKHLAQAKADDFVFFHYSGHGSQAPSVDPTEGDGLDETLVAFDSRESGHFDLLDKELGLLIHEVEAKGAQVALLLDCCHSGSGTRGEWGDQAPLARQCQRDVRPRPPETVLPGVDPTSPQPTARRISIQLPASNHLLLAGCRDAERANEYRSPVDGQWQGATTWFFLQAAQNYAPTLTWADMYDQLYANVRSIYSSQSPQLEGPGHLQLFGGFGDALGSYLRVVATDGDRRVQLNGGTAIGLQPGARLALYSPNSNLSGQPSVLAEVEAELEMELAWAKLERPINLALGSRARIMSWGFGEQRYLVAVEESPAGALVRDLLAAGQNGTPSPFLTVLGTSSQVPSWVVMVKDGHYLLQDATGEQVVSEQPPATPTGAAKVVQMLEHLAIYRNVVRLRNPATQPALAGAIAIHWQTPAGQSGNQITLTSGQRVAFTLQNQSQQPLHITVLRLGADWGIKRIFPYRGYRETLAPRNKTLPIGATFALPANDKTGQREQIEHFKIFVTSQPAEFDVLQLPALNQGDPRAGAQTRSGSPLDWLLNSVRHTGTRPFRPPKTTAAEEWITLEVEVRVRGEDSLAG